ncbi:MAG: hypothetical protein KAW12_18845 [Candidatus Aminicenantes bacterium]|nr:hypothetical protein [Candidatus Aminicenantes bacterium]
MTDIKVDILPEAAKIELRNYYEYLVYKYLKNMEQIKGPGKEKDKNLTAFRKFKKLRNRVNPVVDKSIDIDRLCNEVNSDIF